jgi:DNA-binding NarL/FixJ family response regulator
LARIDRDALPMMNAVLEGAGRSGKAIVAGFDVRELSRLQPDLLIGDVDGLDSDPLELLRQVRFVLPSCIIAVYSGDARRVWGLACHLAGANCLLSKASSEAELSGGVRDALSSGCYTDPRFIV